MTNNALDKKVVSAIGNGGITFAWLQTAHAVQRWGDSTATLSRTQAIKILLQTDSHTRNINWSAAFNKDIVIVLYY